MTVNQQLFDLLKQQFGDLVMAVQLDALDPWIELRPEGLLDVCHYLHDAPDHQYDFLNCLSGVDYFHSDPKKAAKAGWEPHLKLVYHLSSTVTKQRIVLKVSLPRWRDGVEGELPEVPSVSHIWRTADWHEREVYDLMGVRFTGHADLCRILCPEDWVGHPLRKDYKPPEFYHGIRDH